LDDIFAAAGLFLETLLIQYPEIQVQGVVGVADYKNIGLAHIRKANPIRLRQYVRFLQVGQFNSLLLKLLQQQINNNV